MVKFLLTLSKVLLDVLTSSRSELGGTAYFVKVVTIAVLVTVLLHSVPSGS